MRLTSWPVYTALGTIVLLACSLNSEAATVRAVSVDAMAAGAEVRVPVDIEVAANELVSGVQLDLVYDSSALSWIDAEEGPAAEDAGKQVSDAELDSGSARVLIIGFNQTAISSGTLFEAVFHLDASAAPGAYPVELSALVLTDPSGNSVPASAESGYVYLSEPEAEAPGEGEGEGSSAGKPEPSLTCGEGSGSSGDSRLWDTGLALLAGLALLGASRRPCARIPHSVDSPK